MTAKLAYYEVDRSIDFYFIQQQHEREHHLHISEQGLMCATRKFTWHQMHDISYKPFSSGEGFIYLHTYQGMFSYRVKENPEYFLRTAERWLRSL